MTTIHVRVTIAAPLAPLAAMFEAESSSWLETFVRLSCVEGERAALAAAGLPSTSGTAETAARVVTGAAHRDTDEGAVVIPLSWRVRGYPLLPPSFVGRLALVPHPHDVTEIVLDGRWPIDASRRSRDLHAVARAATRASASRLLDNLRVAVTAASEAPV